LIENFERQDYLPGMLKSPEFKNPDERNEKYSFGLLDPNVKICKIVKMKRG